MERHEDEGAKAFDPHLARRLLRYLKPYRARATFSVFLVILSSIMEIAGPAIVAVAIDLYVKPLQGSHVSGISQRIGAWLVGHGWALDPISGINFASAIYFIVLLGGFAVLYTQMVLMNLMGQYIMYDLRKQIFGHLQKLDIQFFDRNPVGRLMTRVTTDVDALNEMFTAGFVSIFGDIFVLLGIVGMLFWMNWRMALVLFSIVPLIILVSAWFRKGARITYRQTRVRIAAINAFLQEHISGMATVQLFNREADEAEKFEGLNMRHRDANLQSVFYYSIFYPVIELIETIGLALIVWYGGGQVLRGMLSIGTLIAFFQYAQRFYEPISDLSEKYNILQAAMAASERIFKTLDTPPRILDEGKLEIDHVESIEFRDVSFAYNEAGTRDEGRGNAPAVASPSSLVPASSPASPEWVLKNVSFSVKRGDRIALVGHTGAGKTTVTSLLLRFYEPQRGQILVNGIDIREYSVTSLRALFAIVQQDFFLFTGSIAQNISLGDESISPERVREAARRVQADRFIQRLPNGYDSEVKERGAGLSVGEKQLLSFARALAFNPPVLVLDEATSSIDTETEVLIQEAIQTLMTGRTSIVIAHRLSTIRSADTILVFHHGEIRERGTHEELMQQDGLYRKLYEIQYREAAAVA
ncbi:MAG: ABC transporter ATP-binding protein [Acidobacteria bacterium]|nr:ABC transporter ATP-binding protein [Acidobacteriota bacterium]MBV9069827.1 ABC transporter ATP-binding protein [Acidobacteriota bacterium]MBV9187773.1 ABC transporter ATP-binding protein [Acidobacteriota bacterium]